MTSTLDIIRGSLLALAVLFALYSIAVYADGTTEPYQPIHRTDPSSKSLKIEGIKPIQIEETVYSQSTKPIHQEQSETTPKTSTPKQTEPSDNHSMGVTCPEGTRPSGGGGCRLEPTGCHLDEQTPMEECY